MYAVNLFRVEQLLKTAQKVALNINGVCMEFKSEENGNVFVFGNKEFTRNDILSLVEVSKTMFLDSVVFGESDSGVYVTIDNGRIYAEYSVKDEKAIITEHENNSVKHREEVDRNTFRMVCIRHNVDVFSV